MDVLVIAETQSANLGDQAIYLGLRKLLEDSGHRVSSLYLSASTEQLASRTGAASGCSSGEGAITTAPGGLKRTFLRVLPYLPSVVLKAIQLRSKARRRRLWQELWTDSISRADLVLFGGGALLMDNDWGFPLALHHASELVKAHHKRYSCVGCSVGTRFSMLARRWLRKFLANCDVITVRDQASARRLLELRDYEPRVYLDTAICTSDTIPATRLERCGRLGLNLLPLVRHEDLTSRAYSQYRRTIGTFLRELDRTPELGIDEIILYNTGEVVDWETAHEFCHQLSGELTRVRLLACDRFTRLEDLVHAVTKCDLVIASRLHASIVPASYEVPIVGIGWDAKVTGFYETVGLSSYCFDYRTCTSGDLLRTVSVLRDSAFIQKSQIAAERLRLKELPSHLFEQHE